MLKSGFVLQRILPNVKTQILSTEISKELLCIKLRTNCSTAESVKWWVEELEDKTNSVYSISTTKRCTGRYLNFKQYLRCQHNTQSKKLYNISDRSRTKNTNCPSSLNITIYAIKTISG